MHAYNCTKNDATGFSPYELKSGQQPRLPVDLAFGLPSDVSQHSHSQNVKNLKTHLEKSYRLASGNAAKSVESTLNVGD